MRRGVVVVALLVVASTARAEPRVIHIDHTGIDVPDVEGDWTKAQDDADDERWVQNGDQARVVTFAKIARGACWADDPGKFFRPIDDGPISGARIDMHDPTHIDVCIDLADGLSAPVTITIGAHPEQLREDTDANAQLRHFVSQYAKSLYSTYSYEPSADDPDHVPAVPPGPPIPEREEPPRPGPPTRTSRVLDWFRPRTIVGGIVIRDGAKDNAGGVGLSASRLTWRQDRHHAIGYDVSVAGGASWLSTSAQLRPGLSTGEGVEIADAYLALGVDGTVGSAGPKVPYAPVAGAGIDLMFVVPGFGLTGEGQALANPHGLHSFTLGAGLTTGFRSDHIIRLGFHCVVERGADPGRFWWFTVGVSNLQGER